MHIISREQHCIYPYFSAGMNVLEMSIHIQKRPIEDLNNENSMSDYRSRIGVNCGHMAPTGIIEETDLLVPSSCDLHEKKAIGL